MIAFSCAGCGRNLAVQDHLAGKQAVCPHCRQVAAIPARTPEIALTNAPTGTIGANAAPPRPPSPEGQDALALLAPPQAPGELGRLGPFRVLRVLGAGGMGVVFEAEDVQLRRTVALKTMQPAIAASSDARQRFLREARAMATLQHDHVVTVYQVGEDRGVPYFAMQFLAGETLEARLKRAGALPLAQTLRIGREIAEALAAAHEKGLIHRDVKPANVWLEAPHGRVKILDFGLARVADDDTHLTGTGAFMGTPAYVAPEQAAGEEVDARCDVFSLGCVLYRMATGSLPFRGPSLRSVLKSVMMDEPLAPDEVAPEVPVALSDLVMRSLAKDPVGRPSAAMVARELGDLAEGPTAEVRPDPDLRRLRSRRAKRARPAGGLSWVSWALIAGGLLFAVGLIAVVATVAIVSMRPPAQLIDVRPDRPERGILVIEAHDPAVEVIITQQGRAVERSRQGLIELPPGVYQLALAAPKEGESLDQTSVTIAANGRVVVKALRDPLLAKLGPHAVVGRHGKYVSVHGADGAGIQAWVAELRKTGYRPIFLNGYAVTHKKGVASAWGDRPLYAGIAVKNDRGLEWELRHDLSSVRYQQTFEEMKPKGLVPVSVTGYLDGDVMRFGGIWGGDNQAIDWWARHNLTLASHKEAVREHTGAGLKPVSVNGYWDGSQPRFSSLYLEKAGQHVIVDSLTFDEYTQTFRTLEKKGFMPLSVSGYHAGDVTRYAAVFAQVGHKNWEARHGTSPAAYRVLDERLTREGHRPLCIYVYLGEGGLRYATVWVAE